MFHLNKNREPEQCPSPSGICEAEDHFETAEEALANLEVIQQEESLVSPDIDGGASFKKGEIEVSDLGDDMLVSPGRVFLPAGRYFVGDTSYTIGRDQQSWSKWLGITGKGTEHLRAAGLNGYPVIGVDTAWGDGFYTDQHGNKYEVDTGMIGVVPEELIKKMSLDESKFENSGLWSDFLEAFEVFYKDGVIHIGEFQIDTDTHDNFVEVDH